MRTSDAPVNAFKPGITRGALREIEGYLARELALIAPGGQRMTL
jgi:hypothetical protein